MKDYTPREHELIQKLAIACLQSHQSADLALAAELVALGQKAQMKNLEAVTTANEESVLAAADQIRQRREQEAEQKASKEG